MKRIFALAACLLAFAVFGNPAIASTQDSFNDVSSFTVENICSKPADTQSGCSNRERKQSSISDKDSFEVAGRGCCSWHKGVCGCSNGRAQCCDGSLSPSCGC